MFNESQPTILCSLLPAVSYFIFHEWAYDLLESTKLHSRLMMELKYSPPNYISKYTFDSTFFLYDYNGWSPKPRDWSMQHKTITSFYLYSIKLRQGVFKKQSKNPHMAGNSMVSPSNSFIDNMHYLPVSLNSPFPASVTKCTYHCRISLWQQQLKHSIKLALRWL